MFLLNAKNKPPLYRQLYQQLRAKILNGELSPYPNILLDFGGIALEDIPPAVRLLREVWLDHA